jgi:hypothetical protein
VEFVVLGALEKLQAHLGHAQLSSRNNFHLFALACLPAEKL